MADAIAPLLLAIFKNILKELGNGDGSPPNIQLQNTTTITFGKAEPHEVITESPSTD